MDMLLATDCFTTGVWSWFRLVLSVMYGVIYSSQRTVQAVHMTAVRMVRWILPISLWSPVWHARLAHVISSVMMPELSALIRCDEEDLRPLLEAFRPAEHRDARSKGLAKAVYLSAVHPHPIRDGPMRGRPQRRGFVAYDNREAA